MGIVPHVQPLILRVWDKFPGKSAAAALKTNPSDKAKKAKAAFREGHFQGWEQVDKEMFFESSFTERMCVETTTSQSPSDKLSAT